MRLIYKISIALLLLPFVAMEAQNQGKQLPSDSLSLSYIINTVVSNYPALLRAEKDLEMANAKKDLTKTAYLPDVNFSTSYTRIGPVTSIMFGGKDLQLYPPDVYNVTFSVNENIYDFGKTNKNLDLDEKNKEIVKLSSSQIKQRLSMALLGNFYTIAFLQEAIKIKDEQLKTLTEHLYFVEKKAATGSATKYEIFATKVRLSGIENQKTDLLTALQIQNGQLNSYLGKPQDTQLKVKNELLASRLIPSTDSLFNVAFANRNEMKIAHQKEEIFKSKLEVIKVQNNPSLNACASGGFKNGYLNDNFQDVGKLNFAVGVGLKVPIFDANRSKYIKVAANADLDGIKQETELTRRTITNEVVESRANALASLKKVTQSELQLDQAQQANALAKTSFEAGTITNLDLLDSYTVLSETEFALLKTKIDYTISLYKLRIALGEQI